MALKISLVSVLLLIALGAIRIGSSAEGVKELNTKDEGYHLEDTDVYRDLADNEIQDIDDTTDAEQRISWAQESEKRAVKRCGPDVTFWLWDQMNRNRHHTEIQRCGGWYKRFAWPRCLLKFAGLVGNCKPWDFKCTQTFRRGSCPSQSCPRTVTLCNQCVNYDVPGNIHYGWVGRAATIRRWLLLYAADRVQKGGIDDPKDQNAIKIGMNMWDDPRKRSRYQMCKEVAQNINSLNRQGTSSCRSCSTRY